MKSRHRGANSLRFTWEEGPPYAGRFPLSYESWSLWRLAYLRISLFLIAAIPARYRVGYVLVTYYSGHGWSVTVLDRLIRSLRKNDSLKEELSMLKGKRQQDKLVRFQLEIKQSLLKEIEELQELGGLSSKKDVINNALTLLRWAVTQKQSGYDIASIDDSDDVCRELQMPYLEQVASHTRRYPRAVPYLEKSGAQSGHLHDVHDALPEGAGG